MDGRPLRSEDARPASPIDVIDAFLHKGPEAFTDLNGAFSIALFDRRKRVLTLAIDRMGITSLAWTMSDRAVTFGTSALAVARTAYGVPTIRLQSIYDYFFFHMIPAPVTAFSDVLKVTAATAVTLSSTSTAHRRYWTPSFDRRDSADARSLMTEVRSALEAAVAANVDDESTGAFLSGGLDSSTVAGYLGKVSGKAARTFSIGFDVDGFNEIEYARITSRHFGCNAHEYMVTPDDVVRGIPTIASSFDEPFGNSSAVPTYLCAKFAKENGIDVLLAGDGGDEIFGGNERYAKHQVFEIFNRLPESARNVARRLVQYVPDGASFLPLRKLRSYVEQACIPLPERFESWNFVYREGAATLFTRELMYGVDESQPMRHMKETYDATPSRDQLDRMLFYDWKFTLADNDLRKVMSTCAEAGVDVRFPMLDNRVVDASIRVPSTLKMRGHELRTFFKRAMTGFLPIEVLNKRKHGFGLPFGQWLKTHSPLADLAYSNLLDFKQRRIVKDTFIDRLITEHRDGNPGYYGYVIWDLVLLEEWLKQKQVSLAI
jgi:asparagine synthase (glutamine-hydrolysing)